MSNSGQGRGGMRPGPYGAHSDPAGEYLTGSSTLNFVIHSDL